MFILYFGLYINDIMGEKGGAHYEEILEQIEKLCKTCSDCAERKETFVKLAAIMLNGKI